MAVLTTERTSRAELDKKIGSALSVLEKVADRRCLVAYSGGKDAMVVSHLMRTLKKDVQHVCETSFYMKPQLTNIQEIAKYYDLNIEYQNSLDEDWLKANNHIIFASDSKLRAWTFAQRQQRTVKRKAKDFEVSIFGRRTEENSVKDFIYDTKNGTQCHPLRNWSLADIWTYFELHKIPTPFIYTTKFGYFEGNAPFYTFNKANVGGDISKCWEVINEITNEFNHFNYGHL